MTARPPSPPSRPLTLRTRAFDARDADAVAALFTDYMAEIFAQPNALTPGVLLRDGQGRRFHLMLAVDAHDRPVGFAAWRMTYDLHHAVAGGEIPDLFVARPLRGRALGVRLIAAVARAVRREGGLYLKGEALQDDLARLRLVRRLAVGFPAESVYVSGRAFRELADLADADTGRWSRGCPWPP
jgi:GNAT superfamily N-acetyltransferase